MEIKEREFRKIALLILIIGLGVLTYLILRPIMISIIGGLLLAYMFFPLYRQISKRIGYPGLSAGIVSVIVLIIIILPLWFLIPPMVQQIFELFRSSQGIDIQSFLIRLFPTASDQFITQITVTANSAISKLSSTALNYLVDLLVDFPTISLHFLLVAFVFFFALKDEIKFKEFASAISPLNKFQEKALVKQFKDITDSIVYGQILVGIFQGIATGIGLVLFGVPNALFLTVFAIILGILPVIGPPLIYLPIAVYLYSTISFPLATIYLVYNLVVVSILEHVIRAKLVSRRTDISQVFILIGMVGGLFIFGILGLVLGPLIIAYFITLLKAYKDNSLSSLFSSD
ncbi:MAG: AI-2E family transporter [Nanoarchaeota archaeon]|nr:AI-2E family transporter [Nanoarchaeota archaeon]